MADLGLLSLSIGELAPMIKGRQVSPVEVTQAAISHAERMQPIINSFISPTPELALRQAQELESQLMRGNYLGPLHGIPIGLKDQFAYKGVLSTNGSKRMENHIADYNAPVVERCLDAGAVVLGKENMHEIGFGFTSDNRWYGPVRNPWDLERFAGGSSGGSAANVASFVTYASVGSDGGGSVREPSAVCGIVGLKPTYGRVSTRDSNGPDPSTGHIGPHTRSVRDCAIMLQAMAGYDPLDPSSVPVPVDDYEAALGRSIKGLVMGIPTNHFFDPLDSEIGEAVGRAITVLEELGAKPRQVEIKHLDLLWCLIRAAHASASVSAEPYLRQNRDDFSPPERFWLLRGQFILARDYIRAQQLRRLWKQEWAKVMQEVDFLVTPTTPVLPWKYGTTKVLVGNVEEDVTTLPWGAGGWLMGRNTSPCNWVGVPAISVPCGFSNSGLPIGLQIIGRPWGESLVLRVAHNYEQVAPAANNEPPAVTRVLERI